MKVRAVTIPWTESLKAGLYELTTGRKLSNVDYTRSVWANACMQIRAMELANLPWKIMKGDKIVEGHKIELMLRDFGRESFWEDAFASTELDKLQQGAAYWLRDVDTLKRLNPNTMKVIKTKDGISGFKQELMYGDKTITNNYTREEIVYFRTYHPDDDLGPGIPVCDVVKSAINTEYEAELMMQALFRNDATPGILFSTDQHVPEEEAERIVGWFNRKFRGSRKKGKVGVVDRNLKPITGFSQTMVESEVIEAREMARTDICVGFRVSKLLVSAFINSTYSNAEESRRSLIENLIVPEAKMYANAINQDLVAQIDPSIRFEFVPEELPIMQEDENERQIRLSGMLRDGVISQEYYREEMGVPETAKPKDETVQVEKQYEKKAMKALARGDSPDVPFETDVLSVDRRILIAARLKNAETKEDIRRAFI